jgi:hypothetical protein
MNYRDVLADTTLALVAGLQAPPGYGARNGFGAA